MEICIRKNYYLGQPVKQTNYCKIYKATEINNSRVVCIKEIDLSVAHNKRDMLNAVNKEIQALMQAGDEIAKVPCIFDSYHDQKENKVYIIMQWVEGDSLRDRMSCTPKEFLWYILHLAEILKQLHAMHIYHKDIKPENVIIKGDDVRLIDFNISLSLPNTIEGTPNYVAPEMKSPSGEVRRKYCDVFALGVMLYEYFAGEVPKNGKHYVEDRMNPENPQWRKYISAKETAASNQKSEVSDEIDCIITKCMRKEPTRRYGDMTSFIRDLRKAMRGKNDR